MRILLIGGAGFIGASLARYLTDNDRYSVRVFDLPDAMKELKSSVSDSGLYRSKLLEKASLEPGDVRNSHELLACMRLWRPTIIYYLAGIPIPAQAETSPVEAADSMVRGLLKTLELVSDAEFVKRFVYISSSMVYGQFPIRPAAEEAVLSPRGVYGGFKLAGEILVRALLSRSTNKGVVVRPSGVYGPGDPHNRIVKKALCAALNGESINLIDPVNNFIDFTWIDDLVEGLVAAGLHPNAAGETFNITRGEGRSLLELAEIIRQIEPNFSYTARQQSETVRSRRGALDITRARNLLHYNPQVSLENGIARYFRHLKEARTAMVALV